MSTKNKHAKGKKEYGKNLSEEVTFDEFLINTKEKVCL